MRKLHNGASININKYSPSNTSINAPDGQMLPKTQEAKHKQNQVRNYRTRKTRKLYFITSTQLFSSHSKDLHYGVDLFRLSV